MAKPQFKVLGKSEVRIIMDDSVISRWQKPGGMVDAYVLEKAGEIAASARRTRAFTDRSGRLRNSITVSQARGATGLFGTGYQVVAEAPYSFWVHEGTPPHSMPKRSKVEGPYGFGRVVLLKSGRSGKASMGPISHPGAKPRPFLTNAMVRVIGSTQ